MAVTTSINPGAYRSAVTLGPVGIIRGSLSRLKNQGWRTARNYFVCQSVNFFASLRRSTRFHCNVCGNDIERFVHFSNAYRFSWNSACPRCDSRKRHRGLSLLYRRILAKLPGKPKLLHFAPEPILRGVIEAAECDYKTTDYLLEDVDFPKEDVQALSFQDASFDCVLSNHVIEHVEDDDAAFRETARILSPGGLAIITIPGDWRRRDTVVFDDLSNNGHYRDYGMDVVARLESHFSNVEVIDLFDEAGSEAKRLSLEPKHDLAFVCTK